MTRRLLDATAYVAVLLGLLLIASAPAPARESEPLRLHWRPATAAEEREYERQRLADFLNEARQHH
ncbi:hypothetical protein ACWD69_09550 [Micromonospora chokoriensis]